MMQVFLPTVIETQYFELALHFGPLQTVKCYTEILAFPRETALLVNEMRKCAFLTNVRRIQSMSTMSSADLLTLAKAPQSQTDLSCVWHVFIQKSSVFGSKSGNLLRLSTTTKTRRDHTTRA